MRFTISYIDANTEINIDTESDDADTVTPIELMVGGNAEGWAKSEIINIFLRELSNTRGFYGHFVSPLATTNADISAAIAKLPSFKVIQNHKLIPSPLPDGALN